MKKIVMLAACGFLFLTSCKKEIEMCIDGDMNPSEPGSYTYNWCGTNADNIEWSGSTNQGTLAGQSVTLDFENKGTFYLTVYAYGNKTENSANYEINVGEYETRVELRDCDYNTINIENYRAYVYNNYNELQTDLRNGNFAGCLDSIDLEQSYYYNNTTNNSTATQVGGFKGLTVNNSYLIYVQQYDNNTSSSQGRSNLGQILYEANPTNILVSNNDYDDILNAKISTDWTSDEAAYVKNLFSKTYELSDVWINGTSVGVSACNADDTFTIDLDHTWEYNIGQDDCSGNQATSTGTWTGIYECISPSSNGITLNASSGSLATSSSNYISYFSSTSFDLYSYDGTNTVQFRFTVQ